MRISLSLTASVFAILLASCGGEDDDQNNEATTGGDPSSVSSTTSGTGGGASTSASSTTSGTGGDPSSSSTGGSTSSGGEPTGTGGDASTSSAGGSTSSSGGSTGEGGSGDGGSGDGGQPVDSGLPVPPGDANVPKPSGAPGGLKVLDWAGFTSAVSYSFDDNNSSQINNYDRLNALGVRFTFYTWTGRAEANNPVWKRAQMDGHEIGNHTQDHGTTNIGPSTDAAQQWIKQQFGIDAYTMAAPYGDTAYVNIARSRFLINRGVSNSVIAPNSNTDPFNLPTYIPDTGASAQAMDQQVASARQAKGWRTFCIHGFTGGNDGAYQPIPLESFITHVQNTKNLKDVWIDSVVNVGAYWRGQKAVTDAVNGGGCTKSGADTTCTWKLPDHFPPGKYLRVTVTGGTPKQNGVPLRWDPHGYYEMALDAGSITISP